MVHIEGRVVSVLPIPEYRSAYQSLFVTFRDGKIIKFRIPQKNPVEFSKTKDCIIHSTDEGILTRVEFKQTKKRRTPS